MPAVSFGEQRALSRLFGLVLIEQRQWYWVFLGVDNTVTIFIVSAFNRGLTRVRSFIVMSKT